MCREMGAWGAQECQHADSNSAADTVKKTVTKARNLRNVAAKYEDAL